MEESRKTGSDMRGYSLRGPSGGAVSRRTLTTKDCRPGLDACLKPSCAGGSLEVWKLDRLGRDLHHLVSVVQDLTERSIGVRILAGQGAQIGTTIPAGRLVFRIFAALAKFERELIRDRTLAGLEPARAKGRRVGSKFALIRAQIRLAQAAM